MNVSSSPEAGRRVPLGAQSEASPLDFGGETTVQQTSIKVEENENEHGLSLYERCCQIKVNCLSLIDLDTFQCFFLGMWHGPRQRSARLQPPGLRKYEVNSTFPSASLSSYTPSCDGHPGRLRIQTRRSTSNGPNPSTRQIGPTTRTPAT